MPPTYRTHYHSHYLYLYLRRNTYTITTTKGMARLSYSKRPCPTDAGHVKDLFVILRGVEAECNIKFSTHSTMRVGIGSSDRGEGPSAAPLNRPARFYSWYCTIPVRLYIPTCSCPVQKKLMLSLLRSLNASKESRACALTPKWDDERDHLMPL